MKSLELSRQKATNPNFANLKQMLEQLKGMLMENMNPNDQSWEDNLEEIVRFQDPELGFSLLDSYYVESDACVEFCCMPTYICTAILMKAVVENEALFGELRAPLKTALEKCARLGLIGHGIDAGRTKIDEVMIFLEGHVREFLLSYADLVPAFTDLMVRTADQYRKMQEGGAFIMDTGEDFEAEVVKIANELDFSLIFVYGTLLKGQRNYHHYLSPREPVSKGTLEGYALYDLGTFPGIVPSEEKVKGEVYLVDSKELASIDRLEGEGNLYLREREKIELSSGIKIEAFVYFYNRDVDERRRIPYMQQPYGTDYVWYVSYGSNMLFERFRTYIEGGICRFNGKTYQPCQDTTLPEVSRPVEIPYDMYYSNYDMGSWENSSVCFLDVLRPGKAYGRAYLIKKSQLKEIHKKEGNGAAWYPDRIPLDSIDGIPAYTFSNQETRVKESFSKVSHAYAYVLFEGIKETYPLL